MAENRFREHNIEDHLSRIYDIMGIDSQLYEKLVDKVIEQELKEEIEEGRITEEYARKFIKTYGIIEKVPEKNYFTFSIDFEKLHSKLGLSIQNRNDYCYKLVLITNLIKGVVGE